MIESGQPGEAGTLVPRDSLTLFIGPGRKRLATALTGNTPRPYRCPEPVVNRPCPSRCRRKPGAETSPRAGGQLRWACASGDGGIGFRRASPSGLRASHGRLRPVVADARRPGRRLRVPGDLQAERRRGPGQGVPPQAAVPGAASGRADGRLKMHSGRLLQRFYTMQTYR